MNDAWLAFKRWAPLFLWMAAIFIVSNQPSGALPAYGPWDVVVKKGGHFLAYALLALLARYAGLRAPAALLLAVAYAISDEFHQLFVPGRNGSVADVVIDGLGALSALLLLRSDSRLQRAIRWAQTRISGEQSPPDA